MFRLLRILPAPIRSTRQWSEKLGAEGRKGCKWRAAPTFVSIRGFDPSPAIDTTESGGPVQSDCLPPMRGVFIGCGRVLPAGWPQNRYGSIPLTSDKGVDTTGQKWRVSG